MPRLSRLPQRLRGDRGTVAALVAVLLAGNVLLGMSALTVDVGLLYAEREQLQSGADAAAVAVAKVCVGNNDTCNRVDMANLAIDYAGDNAKDGWSDAVVCGWLPAGGEGNLQPCGGSATNLAGCVGPRPAAPTPYVEVHTSTRLRDGTTALPPAFAGAVAGTKGTTVGACARVSWGPVRSARVEPAMAISVCEFNSATKNGSEFQPMPTKAGHQAAKSSEIRLRWRRPDGGGGCGGIGNGFGWLSNLSDCGRSVTAGNWYRGQSSRLPSGCADKLTAAYDNRTVVPVAIFDRVDEDDDEFRLVGIAAFVATGWYRPPSFPGGPAFHLPPALGHAPSCAGENRPCVYGYFTTQVFRTGTGALGGKHYGAVYVKTIG